MTTMTYGHELIVFLRFADDLVNVDTRRNFQSLQALLLFIAAYAQIRQIAMTRGELVH